MSLKEATKMKKVWRLAKFKEKNGEIEHFLKNGGKIEDAVELFKENLITLETFEGNVLLNEGIQYLIDIICGLTPSPVLWDSNNARIGVGDSDTPEDPSQTGLLGTNTAYAPMDSGYPQRNGKTAIWRGTFGADQANFHWYEYTVDNGATENINLNRKVADKGVKTQGEVWTLELQITFS